MTTITWPAGFPSPLLQGYGYAMADLTQSTNFAYGRRVRRLYSDAPEQFPQLSVALSASQWAFFQGWYRYTLQGGAQWFLMPLDAAGVRQTLEVRFVGAPKPSLLGDGKKGALLVFACETRQGTTMDQDTYNIIANDFGGDADAYSALLSGISQLANTDMPDAIGA